jgi:DNA-directed RNA polymerase specialized sigma24 family protein
MDIPGRSTDATLVARARSDAAAFGELYQRYAAVIYRYHCRCCGDADAAHDLTAETFAQAWLARARFRDEAGGSAAPWLYGIARNVLLMSVRRHRLECAGLARLGLLGDPAAVSGREHVPDEAWLEQLEAALDELPPTSLPLPAPRQGRRGYAFTGRSMHCAGASTKRPHKEHD